jgi:molybdate transport system permease protein
VVGLGLATALTWGSASNVRGQTDGRTTGEEGEILVLAASSLTDVLPGIADAWHTRTGMRVRLSFDATSRLAPQAANGVPADVFISADGTWIRWLEERGAIDGASPTLIAENELVVVVPVGGERPRTPEALLTLERVALGGRSVPAGRYARQALRESGVWDRLERSVVVGGSVRGVLEWVARGEVPAGIVYRTDAMRESRLSVAFVFDETLHDRVRYWAAPLEAAPNERAAQAFVEYLVSESAAEMFESEGFRVADIGSARGAGASSLPDVGPRSASTLRSEGSSVSIVSAVRISLLVAVFATLVGLAPATWLGWLLARRDFRGKSLVSTIVLAPLVVPPVVTGFLLLTLLGTRAPLGGLFAALGFPVPFSIFGAIVAALIVGMPLYILAIRGAFEAVDPLYEELSWTLGVPPGRTFRRISLPLAVPGIAAGATLAFARSLGEFGATVVLAGNVEGSTRTISLAVYTLLESPSGREAIWAMVASSVGLSVLALFGYEALTRRQRRLRLEDDHGR